MKDDKICVQLPCELGQILYVLPYKMAGHPKGVYEAIVESMEIKQDGAGEYYVEPSVGIESLNEHCIAIPPRAWGWLVFLGKEDAEKAWEAEKEKEANRRVVEMERANQELHD